MFGRVNVVTSVVADTSAATTSLLGQFQFVCLFRLLFVCWGVETFVCLFICLFAFYCLFAGVFVCLFGIGCLFLCEFQFTCFSIIIKFLLCKAKNYSNEYVSPHLVIDNDEDHKVSQDALIIEDDSKTEEASNDSPSSQPLEDSPEDQNETVHESLRRGKKQDNGTTQGLPSLERSISVQDQRPSSLVIGLVKPPSDEWKVGHPACIINQSVEDEV